MITDWWGKLRRAEERGIHAQAQGDQWEWKDSIGSFAPSAPGGFRVESLAAGVVSWDQLDYYLDEFTFRFDRRMSRHREKLFYRLVEQAVALQPTRYSKLVTHSDHVVHQIRAIREYAH